MPAQETLRYREPNPQDDIPLIKPTSSAAQSTDVNTCFTSHSVVSPFMLVVYILFAILSCEIAVRTRNAQPLRYVDFRGDSPTAPEAMFSSERALSHIHHMGRAPREVGTIELDSALQYIHQTVEESVPIAAKNRLKLEVESFSSSGSYSCSMTKINIGISYTDVRSVVARLSPLAHTDEPALLINAHPDSAWGGPGVSDNLIGVGIVMELVRTIASLNGTTENPVLRRPIVFLFNGAEEPLLVGAHGFMTTHRWARNLAAHINTESIGAGNAYLLFQLGPRNSWLIEAYKRAVRSPFASSAGSDLFELGLIPAETDFRIFKDFGVPGFDFALTDNGNVYHTGYDDLGHLSEHAVNSGGKAVFLPLALELAGRNDAIGRHLRNNSLPQFEHVMNENKQYSGFRPTFFDVLGLFVVVYGEKTRLLLDVGMLTLFAILFVRGRTALGQVNRSFLAIRIRMFCCFIVSIFAGLTSSALASFVFGNLLNRPLSWYGSARYACLVYGPHFILAVINTLSITLPRDLPSDVAFDGMVHAVAFFYAGLLTLCHRMGLASAYIPVLLLVPYMLLMMGIIPRRRLTIAFLAMNIPAAVIGGPLAESGLSVLLALLGRAGKAPSELIASLLVGYPFILYILPGLFPLLASAPKSLRKVRPFVVGCALIVGLHLYLAPLLIAPSNSAVYSYDAPKRIMVIHFHAPQQNPSTLLGVVELDAVPLDINATMRSLPDLVQLSSTPTFGKLKSDLSECMRPYSRMLKQWKLFAVRELPPLPVPTASVLSQMPMDDGFVNVSIRIDAPRAMQMSLRVPVPGAIVNWSLGKPPFDMGDKGGCWIRHVGCGVGGQHMEFSVVVKLEKNGTRPPVIFDVSSAMRRNANEGEVIGKLFFPRWMSPVYTFATGASFSL